jgi:hypothetical protein
MIRNYKISIPEPCTEDWNKMTPNAKGRFCSSCSKTVVDFTVMSPIAIQKYFQENSNICGRIKKSQLNSVTIQIPSSVIKSQTNINNMFLLALFVVMGTTIFSCSDKKGSKHPIDKIEIIEDLNILKKIKTDESLLSKKDSINNTTSFLPTKKLIHTKFTKPTKAIINSNTNFTIEVQETYVDNEIYGGMGISVYPEFPGGMLKFHDYIKQNYVIPKKAKHLNGEIYASFVIEKDGQLDSLSLSNDFAYGAKEELIRVLRNSKKWFPGEENGKKRNCKFKISLTIKTDTIKKTFFRTKIISKIDSIEINRITKYDNDRFQL